MFKNFKKLILVNYTILCMNWKKKPWKIDNTLNFDNEKSNTKINPSSKLKNGANFVKVLSFGNFIQTEKIAILYYYNCKKKWSPNFDIFYLI